MTFFEAYEEMKKGKKVRYIFSDKIPRYPIYLADGKFVYYIRVGKYVTAYPMTLSPLEIDADWEIVNDVL